MKGVKKPDSSGTKFTAFSRRTGASKGGYMIVFLAINLNMLLSFGRKYSWKKPCQCPNCHRTRLWGHGSVAVFFDGFAEALFLKRYRCPDCGCVLRIRPLGYLPRFQADEATIRASISMKAKMNRWLRGISRSRQNHWYRGLLRHIAAHLGNAWEKGLAAGYEALLIRGILPVTRSI